MGKYLKSLQELVHKSVKEDLAIQLIVTNGIAESPVFKGDEEWTESGIVQLHHQFQKHFCNCGLEILHRLGSTMYYSKQTFGFKDGSFRISKILRNRSKKSLDEPVRSSRVPALTVHSSTIMNFSIV